MGHTPKPGRVLVTGATGLLGRALVASLCAEGVPVRVLLRHAQAQAEALGLEVVTGDLRAPGELVEAVQGIDTVFHCAGLMHPPPGRERELDAVNAEGTGNLARVARDAGVSRLLLVSSVSVYGEGNLVDVDEQHSTEPRSAYGRSKLRAERALARTEDLAWVVLRPCAMYRPGVTPFLSLWVEQARLGRFPLLRDGATLIDLLHVDDAVAGLRAAATAPVAVGRTYNLAEGARRSVRDMLDLLSGLLGRPLRTVRADGPVGRLRFGLSRGVGPGRAKLDRRMLEALAADRHFLIDRARGDLGFAPSHPLEQGLSETLAALDLQEDPTCRS